MIDAASARAQICGVASGRRAEEGAFIVSANGRKRLPRGGNEQRLGRHPDWVLNGGRVFTSAIGKPARPFARPAGKLPIKLSCARDEGWPGRSRSVLDATANPRGKCCRAVP